MTSSKKQNVTLSLPGELVRALRHKAVDQGRSLSAYVVGVLQMSLEADDTRREAMDRQMRLMETGLNLGTHGRATWTRD